MHDVASTRSTNQSSIPLAGYKICIMIKQCRIVDQPSGKVIMLRGHWVCKPRKGGMRNTTSYPFPALWLGLRGLYGAVIRAAALADIARSLKRVLNLIYLLSVKKSEEAYTPCGRANFNRECRAKNGCNSRFTQTFPETII